jgi:cytochrome c biogenesis factor
LITLPGTTFSYYFVLMLIPILVVPSEAVKNELHYISSKLLWTTYLILLVLIVPAWPFNWNNTPLDIPSGFAILGINWTGAHIAISLAAIVSVTQLFQSILVPLKRETKRGDT